MILLIKDPEYITVAFVLCVLDCNSFIYIDNGKVQFSIVNDYQINYKSRNKNNLKGYGKMITVTKEYKFIIIPNKLNGFEIMKFND